MSLSHLNCRLNYKFQKKDDRDHTYKTEPHPELTHLEVTSTTRKGSVTTKTSKVAPSSYNVTGLPPIIDQGDLGTCVTNAFSYCVSKQTNKAVNLSRLFLYAICRCLDDTPLNQDDGTTVRTACQSIKGYGVCKEYPAERLLRETIIYPIYEGTSQIQSLMVLKDTLKDVAVQAPGFLSSLAGAWAESKLAMDPVKSNLLKARNELNIAIKSILMSIIKNKFKSDIDSLRNSNTQQFLKEFSLNLLTSKTDLTYPFLVAERFSRITCDYYALKCLSDHLPEGDKVQEGWILNFAELVLPRMKMENEYMTHRLPSTLDYMKRQNT
jgi:hypothetical protein